MGERWFGAVWQDGRNAARTLRRHPWRFGVISALIAVGVGMTTAMFTVVDALVLRPVPFIDPDRIAMVDLGGPPPAPDVFRTWQSSGIFVNVAAVAALNGLVRIDERDVTREVARVTPGLFDLLGGVRPVIGRLFGPMDAQSSGADPVLISEDLWRTVCGADPAILGRTLMIDGTPTVVVGVLPSAFRFPGWNTEVWRAARFEKPRDAFTVYVRFGANVPQRDALAAATRAATAVGGNSYNVAARALSLVDLQRDGFYSRAVPILAGGVVLMFLALCLNVSSLVLAGLTARSRELGTRAALGASRGRLIRQTFIEGAVMALLGVVGGIALAFFLVSAARGLLPEAALVQSLHPLALDVRALCISSLAGVIAVIGAGLLPAILATRVDSSRLLHLGGRSTETLRLRVVSRVLLVLQIGLTSTLLLGGTVLVRSFLKLAGEDRGIDTSNILIAHMAFPARSPGPIPPTSELAARLIADNIRALPGVTTVSWSYGHPPSGLTPRTSTVVTDLPNASPVQQRINVSWVDADFFSLYRVPILRGRGFDSADDLSTTVISERLAARLFPGMNAVGHRVNVDGQELLVAGVARELPYASLNRQRDAPQLYFRYVPHFVGILSIRCDARCPDPPQVWRRLQETAAGLAVYDVYPLDRNYVNEFARPRAAAVVTLVFAGLALATAAAGLFSLLSRSVAQRMREFGIRLALGATPRSLHTLVGREALVVTIAGLVMGTLAGLSLTRLISSLLYDVAMTDPLNYIAVGVIVIAVTTLACWRPVRAAGRALPAMLLREE